MSHIRVSSFLCYCSLAHDIRVGIDSFQRAAELFQEALDLAQVTQSSQQCWATTYINLGTCFRKLKYVARIQNPLHLTDANCCRRYEDAKATYQKVLELDPRHSIALGFLGMIYHLMGDIDKAIIKYHEVRISPPSSEKPAALTKTNTGTQRRLHQPTHIGTTEHRSRVHLRAEEATHNRGGVQADCTGVEGQVYEAGVEREGEGD